MNPSNNQNGMGQENPSSGRNPQLLSPQRPRPVMSPISFNGVEATERIQAVLTTFNEKLDQVNRRNAKLEGMGLVGKSKIETLGKALEEEKNKREEQARKISLMEKKISLLESTVKVLKQRNEELDLDEKILSLDKSVRIALAAGLKSDELLGFAEGVTREAQEEFEKLNWRQSKLEEALKRKGKVPRMLGAATSPWGSAVPLTPPQQTVPQWRSSVIAGPSDPTSTSNSGTGHLPYQTMRVPAIRIVSRQHQPPAIPPRRDSPQPSTSKAAYQNQQQFTYPAMASSPSPASSPQPTASSQMGGSARNGRPQSAQGQGQDDPTGEAPAPQPKTIEELAAYYNQMKVFLGGTASPTRLRGLSDYDINLPQCEHCAKLFSSKWRLQKHAGVENKSCWSYTSTAVSKFREHGITNVEGDDRFFCRCSMALPRPKKSFIRHYVYYKAERDYWCGPCNQRFLYKSNIKAHIKTNTHRQNLGEWSKRNANPGGN